MSLPTYRVKWGHNIDSFASSLEFCYLDAFCDHVNFNEVEGTGPFILLSTVVPMLLGMIMEASNKCNKSR